MARSASVFSIAVLIALLLTLSSRAEARAFFVFGDSLVDSGNNNYRATTARAENYPYGIDYPTHRPTGRFSNGYNIPDLISLEMGSEPTMPYLSPELTGERLLIGANFASAGVGILNDTGPQFLDTIKIYEQLEYLEQYQQRVSEIIGDEQTKSLINQALFLITLGSNDFLINYYLIPFSPRSLQFALPDYVRYVISEYKKVLKRVYELGARRVLVTGVGPLGCVPYEIATRGINGQCVPELTRATELFNPQLFEMVGEVNREIGSQVFVGINAVRMHMDFISDPQAYGFVTAKVACCGEGPYNGIGRCTFLSNLCPNRDVYAFWDLFHPSEKANKIIVQRILSGTTDYMHPMNLSSIMALDART